VARLQIFTITPVLTKDGTNEVTQTMPLHPEDLPNK
jgi:hypothetical protein